MSRRRRRCAWSAQFGRRALAGALKRREPWGVWGGELFIAGVIVARKRPRGRPRKYPVADPFAPAAKDEAAA